MIKLQDIIGLPPSGTLLANNNLKINTMPVIEIIPCYPDSGKSPINIFSLQNARGDANAGPDAKNDFDRRLSEFGFAAPNPIRLAFQAESFPTDSFSNEYGETFLNKMADVASEGVGELMQMTNTSNAMEAAKKIGAGLKGLGGLGETAGSMLTSKADQLQNWINKNQQAGGLKGAGAGGAGLISKMLGGQRVDFPMIWKNSAFNSSYSINIKLFNPKPGSLGITEQYIIGPIAMIMLLALPQSDESGETYKWPYFHRITCRGLFDIKAGAITNVSVSKGGDQNQIAWNRRLSQVDIRIDFVNLYSSLVAGGKEDLDRPTLRSYLETLRGEETLAPIYESDVISTTTEIPEISTISRTIPPTAEDPYETDTERIDLHESIIEEDIIDESEGKLPVAPPTSDLRSRSMDEIAIDAGGTTTTGELAEKTASERFEEGIKTATTYAANTQQKLKEMSTSASTAMTNAINTGLSFIKR